MTVALQVLEANSMRGRVELLEVRPEQLSSDDLRGEQVPSEQARVTMVTPTMVQ